MKTSLIKAFDKSLENEQEITLREQIEHLESMANFYSGTDRVRYDDIIVELKQKELILLDLMVNDNVIN